jgi:hypothetical protein
MNVGGGSGYSPGVPYVLVLTVYNENAGSAARTITSVTSPGMTWALRKRSNASATGGLELWWAQGIGALSAGYTVTANFSGSYDSSAFVVIAVTGCANSAAPFDINASVPAALSAPTPTWTPSFTGISTSSTDDLLLFVSGCVNSTATSPSGFGTIRLQFNFGGTWGCISEVYGKTVTALQSGATFTLGGALSNPMGTAAGEAIFDALAGNAPVVPVGRKRRVQNVNYR